MPAADVLAVDAATFVASAVTVVALVPLAAQPGLHPTDGETPPGYLASLREGFAPLRNDRFQPPSPPWWRSPTSSTKPAALSSSRCGPNDIVNSSVALGLVGAVFALGAVTGNALTTWLAPDCRRTAYALGILVAGAPATSP